MCGYAGLLFAPEFAARASQNTRSDFMGFAQNVAHRGNDDARTAFFEHLWLSHYRLAFQDVAHSIQPQLSADQKWVIVFNGEIYNHLELRPQIEQKIGHVFRTRGDTETILAGFLAFGPQIAELLEGEFSFVISRTDGTEMFAARDHFGVKPLFFKLENVNTDLFANAQNSYQCLAQSISFASEIKGLFGSKKWHREGALRQFVGLYEPVRTPIQEVIQCPPGGSVHAKRVADSFEVSVFTKQLAIRNAIPFSNRQRAQENFTEVQNEFAHCLSSSVRERLLSDVELGVYQSGGIDSKAVAFELAASGQKGLKSFTVGFEQAEYDETHEAVEFARYLGFDPHVLRVSNEALAYSYPHAVYASENLQPYTNGAAKWWLSLFTRQYVRGVLTGDGADELLCGYPSFRYCAWWKYALRGRTGSTVSQKISALPMGALQSRDTIYVRKFLADAQNPWLVGSSSRGAGNDFLESLDLWGVAHPLFIQIKSIAEAVLGSEAADWLKRQKESVRSWFLHGFSVPATSHDAFLANPENTLVAWQNYFCHTHLPVQVLNWVGDRMEMANTLEGRTPFLSGKLRTLVHTLSDVRLVAGLTDKALLRRTYAQRFSPEFARTPKRQFNAPFLQAEQLMRTFETQNIFEKAQFSGSDAFHLLQNNISKLQRATNPDEIFLRTHLESARQTAICMSIVGRTIVDASPSLRSHSFEQSVLQNGGALKRT